MQRLNHSSLKVVLAALLVIMLACNMPGSASTPAATLNETQVALSIQSTMLAEESAQATANAVVQVLPTQPPAPTTPPEQPTYTPYPTFTPQPAATEPPAPTAADPQPAAAAELTDEQIKEKIRSANVLVFEDMRGNFDRKPIVHDVINRMRFSGGKVVEVGDALGKFKDQLLSTTQWDLIIVAAEDHDAVQGEFWEYMQDHVNNGAAVIIEMWYMNQHYSDIQPMLSQCGVEYHKDWYRDIFSDPLDYSIYWLDPSSPILTEPNSGMSLSNVSYLYWPFDAGDLLRLSTGGDAQLVAGIYPREKSQYGVLATCMEGRMIIQTFCSHDYNPSHVMSLWENYIVYTLTNHFKTTGK